MKKLIFEREKIDVKLKKINVKNLIVIKIDFFK